MTEPTLRELAQAVVETYAACDALGDDHTVGEWIAVDVLRDESERALDDALGLAGALSADDDRSEAACTILAALDAERHQQTRAMIAALYWRAGRLHMQAQAMCGTPYYDLYKGEYEGVRAAAWAMERHL